MANNINTVAITGNLTRDPEHRTLPSGASVCELSVAVNERVKQNDEWVERANFFDVTVWGKQGEACAQYLAKGRPVAVQGRLRQERWENDKGEKRSKVKLIADTVQFLGGGNGGSGSGASAPAQAATPAPSVTDDSDLPF